MLRIEKAGLMTSVQDQGRTDYRHFGVPISGACDAPAATRANALLENEPGDAVLECTMHGPVLRFEDPAYIAMSGAHMEAELNGDILEMEQVYAIPEGSLLRCGHITEGLRAYIGIKGGVQSPVRLGSRSYFYPVTKHWKLRDGDALEYLPCEVFEPKLLKLSPTKRYRETDLGVSPGPEYEWLLQMHREALFGQEFTLSKDHDRMACQLVETLQPHDWRMITSATLPGTVQLTPSGQLIVLMRDGQTTGGYPRVLQLDEASLNILAQKRHGDSVRFKIAGD